MKKLAAICLFLLPLIGYGQRCVTEEVRRATQTESIDQFEMWMLQKKWERRGFDQLRTETVVQIPVVVHIIHNGEPVGTGINITDDQVLAQIQVINEDFRRTNPDATETQAEFLSVAADFEIEFVLARQDPEGLPTTGIERVNGNRPSWSWAEQGVMKSKSFWPTEDYLNIWVADLTGSSGQNVLGFAQYPSTSLPGVNFGGKHRLVDGVAIDYTVFGSAVYYPAGNYNPNFDRGRTLTHELGHFFGLRHIWGDGFTCGSTDYVDDTPQQLNDTNGCPATKNTCSTNDMFQNYMDYTNDACMNIFTEDQKSRVRTVLMESPRRASLTTSHGLEVPVVFTNDAGITSINAPVKFQCPGDFIPQVSLKNFGSAQLIEVEVQFLIDGNVEETLTINPNLAALESTTLDFTPVTAESKEYSFSILSANTVADENSLLNDVVLDVQVPQESTTPLNVDFESNPVEWIIDNPDNNMGWKLAGAPSSSGSNQALMMENHTYDAIGELDYFISPVLDFTSATVPYLHFDVAYAPYPSEDQDALTVGVILDCGNQLTSIDTVYHKDASALATSSTTSSFFIPLNSSDWRNEGFISLQPYVGHDQVQLVFISQAGYGNNLYIDNIAVTTALGIDIELTSVLRPSNITCESTVSPSFTITNKGTEVVNSFQLTYSIDGSTQETRDFTGLAIPPGGSYEAVLNPVNFANGMYDLQATVSSPNGETDAFTSNNSLFIEFGVDDNVIAPPDEEEFEMESFRWQTVSETSDLRWTWQPGQYVKMSSYTSNADSGTDSWLISPTYDFSDIDKASLFFDIAYSNIADGSEEVFLMTSTDCGSTFDGALYQKNGANLSTAPAENDFTPDADDWRKEFVLLNSLAGESQVRLAIRAVHGGGNNIYLDNLRLFIDDDPDPLELETRFSTLYPNPTSNGKSNITFDLETKEDVTLLVVDRLGRRVVEKELPNVLNQTFEIDLSAETMGLYIVRVVGSTIDETFRLIVVH